MDERNWAGNYSYKAPVVRPQSVDEVQSLVATHERVRALGTRHSFTDIADTDGVLVSLQGLPLALRIDEPRRTASVSGGTTFHTLTRQLYRQGWALPTLASLPHISVAGAIATGTHGSGKQVKSLAAMVSALEVVRADGELRRIARDDPEFDGSVVNLGALGVVTRVTLDLLPTFDMWQVVWLDMPWDAMLADFDTLVSSGYSVSLFTTWTGPTVSQLWVKGLAGVQPPDLHPARPAGSTVHMIPGLSRRAVTEQLGVVGPWHERLPHFRPSFTPSSGAELQTEYLVPVAHAHEAIEGLRARGDQFTPILQVSEIRTVAADNLWLSGAFATDVIALHFTWQPEGEAVYALLPELERLLLPLGARPHWGKCFTATGPELSAAYPMLDRFRQLRDRSDPTRKFDNAFLDRVL
ncbi:MAG TPA: FAD-binding protein [Nocardioides sp.]|nr:FAD-binding protein [Nocardioides sp.]